MDRYAPIDLSRCAHDGGPHHLPDSLVAIAPGVQLKGIALPKGTKKDRAHEMLAPFVADPNRFTIERGMARP